MQELFAWVDHNHTLVVGIVSLIVFAGVVWRLFLLRAPDRRDELPELVDLWKDAAEIALDIVLGVEQLYLNGKLKAENRLPFAIQELRLAVPGLTDEQLRLMIESAVYMLKLGSDLIGEQYVQRTDADRGELA